MTIKTIINYKFRDISYNWILIFLNQFLVVKKTCIKVSYTQDPLSDDLNYNLGALNCGFWNGGSFGSFSLEVENN